MQTQTYTRRQEAAEARKHEGPKLTVISSLKGEQVALTGDYLVVDGNRCAALRAQEVAENLPNFALGIKGAIYVVPKAEFEADFFTELPASQEPEERAEEPAVEEQAEEHTETHE